jgi:ABC-type glycerol-3-phosphate transport system substrate-binding protein
MTQSARISRRTALKVGAGAAALPLVRIRTAGAAGKLSIALLDHWVPDGNAAMQKQVDAWAAKNKVEVQADFITTVGNKLLMTAAAEAQAKTGHDICAFFNWDVYNHAGALAPVDDVVTSLAGKYGAVNETATYLAKQKDHWIAVPTSSASQHKPPCARISWFKKHGLDLQGMYPVRPEHTPLQDQWTWDALLKYAELAAKEGMAFGLGLGGGTINTDATDTHGALFKSFGAELIDVEGAIKLDSDEVHQVLEYGQKLVQYYPQEAVAYDDASNNRALISGKSALIFNPPSAWAVAVRDNRPVGADCWTFSAPSGPKGRFVPSLFYFWGVWSFSRNQTAAKELLHYLMEREQVEERCKAVDGYDIPPFAGMLDFKVWETVEPPPGTVYNYPIRPWHNARPSLTASEASPDVAVQIYNAGVHNQMLARLKDGQAIPQVIAWAKRELEGYAR